MRWVKRAITYFLYRNYRRSAGVKYWFRRKFTPPGGLAIAAMVLMGGVGVDTSQAVAYQAFVLFWCLLVTSLIWSFIPAPPLRAHRTLPRVGTAGQPLVYHVEVINSGSRPQASVTLSEDFGDPRPTFTEFAGMPEPGERKRNLFDRFFRFYRWMWLIDLKNMATSVPLSLPPLQSFKKATFQMRLTPHRRGHLHLEGLAFSVTDPFGFCRRFSRWSSPQKILILPRRYILPKFDFGGASHYQPGGLTTSSSLGESDEFLSVREYRRGDPLRHIHWKSTSKTGKLIVKEFQSEFFVRHALVLDTFSEQASNPVFEEAVSIAASFAFALNSDDSLLDLLFIGTEAFSVSTGQGVAQIEHMLEILAAVQPASRGSFADLEDLVLRQAASVGGCVSIFLKWDEERRTLVEQLATLAIPQIVIILKGPRQKDPNVNLSNLRNIRVLIVDTENVQESLSHL